MQHLSLSFSLVIFFFIQEFIPVRKWNRWETAFYTFHERDDEQDGFQDCSFLNCVVLMVILEVLQVKKYDLVW